MTKYVYMLWFKVEKGGCRRRDSWRHKAGMYGKTDPIYVGMSGHWATRFLDHCFNRESDFLHTFRLREIRIIYVEKMPTDNYNKALKYEKEIKGLTRPKKLELAQDEKNLLWNIVSSNLVHTLKYRNIKEPEIKQKVELYGTSPLYRVPVEYQQFVRQIIKE